MSGEVVRHYPIGSHSLLASATNFSCSIEPHFAAPEQTRTIADIFRTCQTYHLYDDILLVLESSHVADVVRDLWKRGNIRILLQYLSLPYFHSVRNHPPPVHNLLNLLATPVVPILSPLYQTCHQQCASSVCIFAMALQ